MLNRLNEMVLFVCGGHASKDGDSQGAQEHKNLEEHQVLVGEDKGSDDISDPLVVEYLEQHGGLAPAVPRNLCPEEGEQLNRS